MFKFEDANKNPDNKVKEENFLYWGFRNDGTCDFLKKYGLMVDYYDIEYNWTKDRLESYTIIDLSDGGDSSGIFAHFFDGEYLFTTSCYARKAYNCVTHCNPEVCYKYAKHLNEKAIESNKIEKDEEFDDSIDSIEFYTMYRFNVDKFPNAIYVNYKTGEIINVDNVDVNEYIAALVLPNNDEKLSLTLHEKLSKMTPNEVLEYIKKNPF